MSFLKYAYNIDFDLLAHGSDGVKHTHEHMLVDVARNRLSAAQDRNEARDAVREIVANLIGCEEFTLFEIDYGKAVMWPRWCFGTDAAVQRPVDLIAFPELNPALQGQVLTFNTPSRLDCFPFPVHALVPITCDDAHSALLVLFNLLPQKKSLSQTDKKLLEILSLHGGRALKHDRRPSAWELSK